MALFKPCRKFIENGTILTSSEDILSTDDRAGIAVLLETLLRIEQTEYKGLLEIAFTVKEEIGLI